MVIFAEWIGSNRFTVHRLEAGGQVGLPIALRAVGVLGHSIALVPRAGAAPTIDDKCATRTTNEQDD